MKISRVLVVSKKTEVEFNEEKYGAAVGSYYVRNGTDIAQLEKNHDYHYQSLERVLACFRAHGVEPGVMKKQAICSRDFREPWDLVVPVGGDGTFMDAARYILNNTLVFGIKSSPNSFGGHYNANFSDAEEKIDRFFAGDYSVEKRTRVEGIVESNGFSISDHALNEIYVGDIYSPGYSRIDISLDGKIYSTGSSGIVVSSYRGRTGWYNNIKIIESDPALLGLIGPELSIIKAKLREAGIRDDVGITTAAPDFMADERDAVRYKVRETKHDGSARVGRGYEYGILFPGQEMVITSRMLLDGAASFDGHKPSRQMQRHRAYELPMGSRIRIRVSDRPLHVVEFA